MSGSEPFDPTGESERHIGRGMFEEGMGPGSSMAHLYRGEVHRMTFWRERLDRTTNWAVTIMAAILTWTFTSDNPHYILLVGMVMLTVFLVIEARRYRGYDLWRSRVRLLQANVFANALDPSQEIDDPHWRRELSEDYRTPRIKISFEEALAHRLRRIYLLVDRPARRLAGPHHSVHARDAVARQRVDRKRSRTRCECRRRRLLRRRNVGRMPAAHVAGQR